MMVAAELIPIRVDMLIGGRRMQDKMGLGTGCLAYIYRIYTILLPPYYCCIEDFYLPCAGGTARGALLTSW